ncbi:hypothetical protein GQ457_01G017620 [Hibiscus cannabinus]
MSQDLESMFKGLPHVSNIGLRVSGVEELNVGGGSGSQRADSKRARRVDDDLGENEFDSSDSERLVDERLVSNDDNEEITTLRGQKKKFKQKIKSKTVGDEDLQPYPEFNILPTVRNEDVDGVGEDDGNETDYLDSSDAGSYESDSDGEILFKKSSKVFFDTSSVEPRFEVGMIFESPQQFKEALYAYAVAQRFDFKFLKNEKERTRAKCKARGCPFRIYASFDKGDGCFKIKTFISELECSITFKNKRANYLLVGKHFLSKIRIVPNLKLVEIKRLAKEELKVELHKHTCMKAKSWCLEQIRGRLGYEFSRLYDYVGALRDADPSGSFELKVERPTPFEIPKFRRLYVCFSTLKEAFRTYCRPVLSLDGCFLKGDFKGELLSTVGRDANNQIFPIAWAVVEVENRETWAWFLENLRIDLHLIDGEKFTVISDMQKVNFVLDIYANWRKKYKGGDLQLLFWAMCKATTEVEFQRHSSRMSKLKDKALRSLMTKDPKYWSKAYFSTKSKCDVVDNNFSEAFNSAIVPARFKSIISLFEDVRHYVMNRLVSNKLKCQNWKTELCPKICKKLEENKTSSAYCHVTWNGADGYEVFCKGDVFIVDIKGWKCTCRSWDLIGIPCPHVVCVILYRQERPEEYVIDSYKTSTYCSLYNSALPSIPSEKFWNDTRMGPIDPPLKRKLPGRPKHKRKKEEGEQANGKKLSKRGVKMSCRLCGQFGHNIRTCPKKKKSDVSCLNLIFLSTTTLVSQPPRTNVTASREKTNVEIASSAIQIKKSPPIVLATKANQEPKKHLSIGPRGRTIMEGLGLYTNETTGLQILNPGSSSQILVSKPRHMKYSITRAHSPSVPFKSSSMAFRPPTSTSLPPTTSSQPPTTVSLPLSTASSKQLSKQRSEISKLALRRNTPTIWRY